MITLLILICMFVAVCAILWFGFSAILAVLVNFWWIWLPVVGILALLGL